jgi:hypothetical protein
MEVAYLTLCFTGIRPLINVAVDQANIADRSLVSPFSSHWAVISTSASRFNSLAQVRVNCYSHPARFDLFRLSSGFHS